MSMESKSKVENRKPYQFSKKMYILLFMDYFLLINPIMKIRSKDNFKKPKDSDATDLDTEFPETEVPEANVSEGKLYYEKVPSIKRWR